MRRSVVSIVYDAEATLPIIVSHADGRVEAPFGTQLRAAAMAEEAGLEIVPAPEGIVRWERVKP